MAELLDFTYEEVEIRFVAGDAIRFKVRAKQRDPDDPGPDDDPNIIPLPLDGYTVAAQVRLNLKKDTAVLAEFIVEIDEDESDLIWVYFPPDQSELLRGVSAARWDLQLTDDTGDPRTVMGGPMKPKGDATRE